MDLVEVVETPTEEAQPRAHPEQGLVVEDTIPLISILMALA